MLISCKSRHWTNISCKKGHKLIFRYHFLFKLESNFTFLVKKLHKILLQNNNLKVDFVEFAFFTLSASVSSRCHSFGYQCCTSALCFETLVSVKFKIFFYCSHLIKKSKPIDKMQPGSLWTHCCILSLRSLLWSALSLSPPLYSFQTEGSWGRHLRWRCIGKATGLALPITHRRGRHTPTQPAPHTAWALSSKISGMISVKLGVYFRFPSS